MTKGLHAAVRNGELRRCPVWTAFSKTPPLCLIRYYILWMSFLACSRVLLLANANVDCSVTHQSASPTWIDRRSRHRIWLRDVYPYVFCQKYKKRHQVTKNGSFEIYFVNEEGMSCSHLHDFDNSAA